MISSLKLYDSSVIRSNVQDETGMKISARMSADITICYDVHFQFNINE